MSRPFKKYLQNCPYYIQIKGDALKLAEKYFRIYFLVALTFMSY